MASCIYRKHNNLDSDIILDNVKWIPMNMALSMVFTLACQVGLNWSGFVHCICPLY